jgi:hypothetical protein
MCKSKQIFDDGAKGVDIEGLISIVLILGVIYSYERQGGDRMIIDQAIAWRVHHFLYHKNVRMLLKALKYPLYPFYWT